MRQPFYHIEQICLPYRMIRRRIYLVEIGIQQRPSCIVQANQLYSVKSFSDQNFFQIRIARMISLLMKAVSFKRSFKRALIGKYVGLPLSDEYGRLQRRSDHLMGIPSHTINQFYSIHVMS